MKDIWIKTAKEIFQKLPGDMRFSLAVDIRRFTSRVMDQMQSGGRHSLSYDDRDEMEKALAVVLEEMLPKADSCRAAHDIEVIITQIGKIPYYHADHDNWSSATNGLVERWREVMARMPVGKTSHSEMISGQVGLYVRTLHPDFN